MKAGQAGFSLIEILFAVAILSVGFLLVLGMFPTSFVGIRQGRDHMVATSLAQYYMDAERSKPFDQMAGNTYSDRMTAMVNGQTSVDTYTTVVDVAPVPDSTTEKVTITVTTQWSQVRPGGGTFVRSVQMQADRAREF